MNPAGKDKKSSASGINIFEVAPISRSRQKISSLSYFSTKPIEVGDLVSIGLRKKIIPAVVKKSEATKNLKSEIKKKNFRLKPIHGLIRKGFFTEEWFEILRRLNQETLVPESLILFKLFPKILFSKKITEKIVSGKRDEAAYHQKFSLKGSLGERIIDYRTMIREHFAKNKSLMIISPHIETLKNLEIELSRGIEEYVFSFSSAVSKKKYETLWNKATSFEHPILILGTPQVLSFERRDIETSILDDEGSPLYQDQERPWLDFRRVAEIITEEKRIKLILAGEVLRVETIWRTENGLIEALNPVTARIQSRIETELVGMDKGDTGGFSWISGRLASEVEEALFKGERILVFANRRGYSSFTVCFDCNRTILCPSCSVPLVIHGSRGEEKKFLCHHCLNVLPLPDKCPFCSSWRLKDYGLGIQKIEEELKKNFPKADILRLDKDASSGSKTKSVLSEKGRMASRGLILSTELIFSHPSLKFDLTAVVSLDNLFTLPDFRMNERVFRLISRLKERTERKMLLQTRLAGRSLFEDALSGNISHFYQDEIGLREKFLYPPFVKMVLLRRESSNKAELYAKAGRALEILKDYNPASYGAFVEKIKNLYRRHIVIKVAKQVWQEDKKLPEVLSALESEWDIVVDPESVI